MAEKPIIWGKEAQKSFKKKLERIIGDVFIFVVNPQKEFMVTVIKKGSSKKEMEEAMKKLSDRQNEKGVDTLKYCGTIELKEDPLAIQKKVRDEWQ